MLNMLFMQLLRMHTCYMVASSVCTSAPKYFKSILFSISSVACNLHKRNSTILAI